MSVRLIVIGFWILTLAVAKFKNQRRCKSVSHILKRVRTDRDCQSRGGLGRAIGLTHKLRFVQP